MNQVEEVIVRNPYPEVELPESPRVYIRAKAVTDVQVHAQELTVVKLPCRQSNSIQEGHEVAQNFTNREFDLVGVL